MIIGTFTQNKCFCVSDDVLSNARNVTSSLEMRDYIYHRFSDFCFPSTRSRPMNGLTTRMLTVLLICVAIFLEKANSDVTGSTFYYIHVSFST